MSDLNRQHNRAVWFDIPVADVKRAAMFYEAVLNVKVHQEKFNEIEFAVIEHGEGNGGCLVPRADEVTSDKGPLLYLNVDGRLHDAVLKTRDHGGQVVDEVHSLGPHGFRALVLDSEGNRIALHSESDA